jgi:hypothetical protein
MANIEVTGIDLSTGQNKPLVGNGGAVTITGRNGVGTLKKRKWLKLFTVTLVVGALAVTTAAMVCGQDLDLPVEKPGPKKPEPPKPPEDPPPTQEDEKPPTIYGSEVKSETASIVYVIDVSGSMGLDHAWVLLADGTWDGKHRLNRAKLELEKSIASLPKNWKFDVVAFSSGNEWWSPSLQPADDAHKAAVAAWIKTQEPHGGTWVCDAMCAALWLRENKLVILLTDGEPSCGWHQDHRAIIRAGNAQGATVNVFGISCPRGSTMELFCRGVASDNNGTYIDVR